MNYSASVVDEVAPARSEAPPSARAAEATTHGQAEKEARRAESRRLAIAAQSGCIESFESLVGQFEKPLYHFLLTKTCNHHQAEDLLQDLPHHLPKTGPVQPCLPFFLLDFHHRKPAGH